MSSTSNNHSLSFNSHNVLAWSLVALVRILVGFQPYSGQDNWHGSSVAYGGDAEAQRHWMELTYHLPIGEWYHHDLEYWGLDYPPLTAYVSYICGALAHRVVGPHSISLYDSRYYEMDQNMKAFMRATVVVLDLSVYGTAIWMLLKDYSRSKFERTVYFVVCLFQPAFILIDHGHFQYNTVALGLSLWSFYFMTQPGFARCILGGVFFVCSLSFKQTTLYYAPVVFSYLLARCIFDKNERGVLQSSFFNRFASLGVTVLASFCLLWWPFIAFGSDDSSYFHRLLHVLHRIFPFHRGLFESKVSNIWFVLSLKPISIRNRIPLQLQPFAALVLTIVMMTPCCIAVFRDVAKSSSSKTFIRQRKCLLLGATSCALSFFLSSFQVHEKSLLIALAPATLLPMSGWFGLVVTWTLWPLLVLDRLQFAYICTIIFFVAANHLSTRLLSTSNHSVNSSPKSRYAQICTYVLMMVLHTVELTCPTPERMPDLFVILRNAIGCGFVSIAWLVCTVQFSDWRQISSHTKKSN